MLFSLWSDKSFAPPTEFKSNKSISVVSRYTWNHYRWQNQKELTACWTPLLFFFSLDNLPPSALYLASGLASIGEHVCITIASLHRMMTTTKYILQVATWIDCFFPSSFNQSVGKKQISLTSFNYHCFIMKSRQTITFITHAAHGLSQ